MASVVNISVDWSTVLNIGALLVAVYSVLKMRTARQAEQVARQKLLNQRAAEEFDEMARSAAHLTSLIRSSNWERSAEIATALRGGLARAVGSWPNLVQGIEKDKIEVASNDLNSLIEMIPVDEQTVEVEKTRAMMAQCNFVIDVVAEIAGQLKYLDES